METFILLMSLISIGGLETYTYKFELPPCIVGQMVVVQSPIHFVAVVMKCETDGDGTLKWGPVSRVDPTLPPKVTL